MHDLRNLGALLTATVVFLFASLFGFAAERQSEDEPVVPAWKMEGELDFGFRWSESSGNEDKYFEDWNYGTGPRLFNLDVTVTPSSPSPVLDLFNVTAIGLGGDPYATLGLRLRKYGAYDFRYRRRSSAYFYHDIIVPHAEASISASSGGDFHTFDFERVNDEYSLEVDLNPQASVFVQFNRQTRFGESTTTLDVSRDEFELDRPLSEEKNDYLAGLKFATDKLSLYFDQSYRDYQNDGRLFLPGASAGENPEGTTELFSFEQNLPFDFTMPQTTVRVNARPTGRLVASAAFIASALDGEYDYQENALGVAFDAQPLNDDITGRGTLERDSRLADIDISYGLSPRVSVIGGVRLREFDQEGELLLESELTNSSLELTSRHAEVGARFHPLTELGKLSVTAGARFESRDVRAGGALGTGDTDGEELNTQRTTGFVNATLKPSSRIFLLGEFERGDYDNPYTLMSPTSQNRLKLRFRYRDPRGISLVTSLLHRDLDNSVSEASSNTTSFSTQLNYQRNDVSVFGGYSRQAFDQEIDNLVLTAPGFLGGQSFDLLSLYEARIDSLNGGGRVVLTELVTVGGDVNVYRNRGSFSLDWTSLRIYSELNLSSGYLLRCSYRRATYGEEMFDFDDYDANIVTVSFGYRF